MSNMNQQMQQLEAPKIPGALPDVSDDQENLLPVEQHSKPLLLSISDWQEMIQPTPPPGRPIELVLLINDVSANQFIYRTPIDPEIFPLQLPIAPEHFFAEGRHKASYSVLYAGVEFRSPASFFTVDKTSPNAGNPGPEVGIPDKVQLHGITTAYLAQNNDSVEIVVSKYIDQRVGDVISLHLGNVASPAVLNCTVHDSNSDTVIPLKGEIVRAVGNGLHYLFYRLKDRAGNIGQTSQYRPVHIVLDQE